MKSNNILAKHILAQRRYRANQVVSKKDLSSQQDDSHVEAVISGDPKVQDAELVQPSVHLGSFLTETNFLLRSMQPETLFDCKMEAKRAFKP